MGVDYTCYLKCKTSKVLIVASSLDHNGILVNINDLNLRKTKKSSLLKGGYLKSKQANDNRRK